MSHTLKNKICSNKLKSYSFPKCSLPTLVSVRSVQFRGPSNGVSLLSWMGVLRQHRSKYRLETVWLPISSNASPCSTPFSSAHPALAADWKRAHGNEVLPSKSHVINATLTMPRLAFTKPAWQLPAQRSPAQATAEILLGWLIRVSLTSHIWGKPI